MNKGGVVALILLILVLAGCWYAVAQLHQADPMHQAEVDRFVAETAQRQAEAPIWLVVRVVFASLAALGFLVLAALYGWGGYQIVRRKAHTVYADAGGVMPAVVLRPGEHLADAGALAGPLSIGEQGPTYALPEGEVPALQEKANHGAGVTRAMRAWATRAPEHGSLPVLAPGNPYPPVETLSGDPGHVYRLLKEGEE